MKQYALCSQDDLNEIQEQLNNMENGDDNYYDMIAPNPQKLELQDEEEGVQALHPDLTETYDLQVYNVCLYQKDKPYGIIWIKFDHADVGEKTRHDNRHLYVQVYNLHGHLLNQSPHSLLLVETEQLKL